MSLYSTLNNEVKQLMLDGTPTCDISSLILMTLATNDNIIIKDLEKAGVINSDTNVNYQLYMYYISNKLEDHTSFLIKELTIYFLAKEHDIELQAARKQIEP